MEYVQMTLDDWVQMKQKLKQELLGVKHSFVRIGYALRKIEDQRLYEQDGYKSIAEFAKTEYGLEPSTTSRFMSINREYSVDGYSETLRPEFEDLGRSQLEEMLKLPDSDRQMIQPETSREDIRDLKRFNKTEPAAGVADDIHQLVEKFYKDNPDILNEVFSEPPFEEQTIKRFAEIVNPGGNRSYKKGLFFLMMYENRVAIKKFGDSPKDMTWWQFYLITMDIFKDAAGQAAEPAEAESQKEGIAPAQQEEEKETQEEMGVVTESKEETKDSGACEEAGGDEAGGQSEEPDGEAGTEDARDAAGKVEEPKEQVIEPTQEVPEKEPVQQDAQPQEKGEMQQDIPDIIAKPFGTRKDYMDMLTAYDMAKYMAEEYVRHSLKASSLAFPLELEKWLLQEVDENGREIE